MIEIKEIDNRYDVIHDGLLLATFATREAALHHAHITALKLRAEVVAIPAEKRQS